MDEDRLRELLGQAELQVWMREYTRALMQEVMKPEVETDITDTDMIKLHIDIALKNGDREKFMTLTAQLRGMTQLNA